MDQAESGDLFFEVTGSVSLEDEEESSSDGGAPPPPLPRKTEHIRKQMIAAATQLTKPANNRGRFHSAAPTVTAAGEKKEGGGRHTFGGTTHSRDASSESGSAAGAMGFLTFFEEAESEIKADEAERDRVASKAPAQGLFAFLNEEDLAKLNAGVESEEEELEQQQGPKSKKSSFLRKTSKSPRATEGDQMRSKKSPRGKLEKSPRKMGDGVAPTGERKRSTVRMKGKKDKVVSLNAQQRNSLAEPLTNQHNSSDSLKVVRDALSRSLSNADMMAPPRHAGYFGVPLPLLVRGDVETPLLISLSMGALSGHFGHPGLFTKCIPGMSARIEAAQTAWESKQAIDGDPYVVAELMKTFVSMLPNGLILGLAKDLANVLSIGDTAYRQSALHSIMSCVPQCNRDLLCSLCAFLNAFAQGDTLRREEIAYVWAISLKLDSVVLLEMMKTPDVFKDTIRGEAEYVYLAGRRVVCRATLDHLLSKLLDEYYRVCDPAFADVFLVTHPYFIESTTLFSKLISAYKRHTRPPIAQWQYMLRLKILKFLKLWFDEFLDPSHISRDFLENDWAQFLTLVEMLPGIEVEERALLDWLNEFQFSDKGLEKRLRRMSVAPTKRVLISDAAFPNVFQYDPLIVAAQMSLVDQKLFKAIQPIECLGGSYLDQSKAVNFASMTSKFNQWSGLVATTIIRCADVTRRAECVNHWILVANGCRKLNNYNSCYAILAGLNMTPIQRLKQTWKRVPRKMLGKKNKLDALFKMEGNYRIYKEALRGVQGQAAVPYLGLYSKYLLAIETAQKTFTDKTNTMVNFVKMRLIFIQCREMLVFQRTAYTLEKLDVLYNAFVAEIVGYPESRLYDDSQILEPKTLFNK